LVVKSPNKPLKLGIVLLAAGCSARLGQAKQLVCINEQSLIIRQCQLALEISEELICVLGFQAQKMKSEIAHLPLNVVINDNWQQGLSSSIAIGVSSLPDDIDGVMLLLVDQWQLTHQHLTLLINTWKEQALQDTRKNIIVSAEIKAKNNEHVPIGPPVIFPKQYFPALKALIKGQGAKSVIQQHQESLIKVSIPQAFIDLDTPEQLILLENYFKAN